jgi:hypothetical protein|tara:strand:- start:314 stop:502 length:189 start_codon:yes stop_codon:yes gene_type:complete
LALTFEKHLTARSITDSHRNAAWIEASTNVGNDSVKLILSQIKPRHPTIGNAGGYDLAKIIV